MAKSKYATNKPFDTKVCDALRHHVGMRKSLESKRSNAFDDRDAALEELNDLKEAHSPEALRLKERHSDAVVEIDRLNSKMKWHNGQIDELIEKADEPEFDFMLEMPDEPKTTAKKKAEAAQQTFGAGAPPEGDARPVGRPKPEVEAKVPVGENQHLLARVLELDMRDQLKIKCVDAGLGTIGALHDVIKADDDEAGTLAEKLGVDGSMARQVRAAVVSYLKKHTKAEMAVERGGEAPAPDNRAQHGKGAGKSKRK